MRKFLFSLIALAGAPLTAASAHDAPAVVLPGFAAPAHVQVAQYREDERAREWRRHEEERRRREEERHRWHEFRHGW